MIHEFLSVDELISSFENKFIDTLYDFDLLNKFTIDTKKIFIYFFLQETNKVLSNPKLLVYHTNNINNTHDLLNYCPEDKINNLINKLCIKLKRITGKIFFIKNKIKLPSRTNIETLDGEIIDNISLLSIIVPNLGSLNQFLEDFRLSNLYQSMSKSLF